MLRFVLRGTRQVCEAGELPWLLWLVVVQSNVTLGECVLCENLNKIAFCTFFDVYSSFYSGFYDTSLFVNSLQSTGTFMILLSTGMYVVVPCTRYQVPRTKSFVVDSPLKFSLAMCRIRQTVRICRQSDPKVDTDAVNWSSHQSDAVQFSRRSQFSNFLVLRLCM